MPNPLKKRKLQRPKYSLAKQLDSTDTATIDLDNVPSDKEESKDATENGNPDSAKLKEGSEVTYLTNDYLTGIEGVDLSLSIQEDNEIESKRADEKHVEQPVKVEIDSNQTDYVEINNTKSDFKPENPKIKPENSEVKPKISEAKPTIPEVKPENPDVKPKIPDVISEHKTTEKEAIRNSNDTKTTTANMTSSQEILDLDMIIADLQSVVPTTEPKDPIQISDAIDSKPRKSEETKHRPATMPKPKRTTKPSSTGKSKYATSGKTKKPEEYDKTKNAASATELSALIDSIVCDMDAFVQDPYADSKGHSTSQKDHPQTSDSNYEEINEFGSDDLDEGYDTTGKVESNHTDYDIYARVDKKRRRRFDSTPNLYHVHQAPNDELDTSNEQYDFHSLRYPKPHRAAAAEFYPSGVSPEKKSVSFNNVVFEVHHPRYSINSSDKSLESADATMRKTMPSNSSLATDDTQYLLHGDNANDVTYNRGATYASATTSVSTLHDETHSKTRLYESVTSVMSDDAVSMPSEDELYTSGNETEAEEENPKKAGNGRKGEQQPFMPPKVRKLIKSRTIFLILTWFTMGVITLLPSSSLRTPTSATSFTSLWQPDLEMLLSKGVGFFFGICIGGLGSWLMPSSLEVSVITSLLMLSGSLAARPWCITFLLMCASHAVEGTGRGLATIASHMLLHRLWRSDTVFLILHCLFIAFAAGMSVVPPLTFTLNMHAPNLMTGLHTLMLEEWVFAVESAAENGHQLVGDNINQNGGVNNKSDYDVMMTTQSVLHGDVALTTDAGGYGKGVKEYIVMMCMQIGVAVIPFLLALVFMGFALYTCIGNCRNRVQKYRYRKKMENYRLLKEKVSNSIPDAKVFPNLNGSPGENASDDLTKEKQANGRKLSNGKVSNDSPANSKSGEDDDDKNSKDGSTKSKECEKADDKDETHSNGHVTHVVNAKNSNKKLAFKFPEKNDKTKFKSAKKKQTWLLNDQKCGIITLLYLYVFFSLAAALECILVFFLYSYAIETLHFSEFRSILLLTLFLICFAFSRIASLLLSRFIPPNALVVGCLALSVMSSIIFVVYGGHIEKILWLFLGILGVCIGPILPGGLTWANIYLNLNYKSLSLAYWLMALGMTIFGTFAGALLQFVDSQAVLWLVVALCAFSFLIFLPTMPYIRSRNVLKLASRSKADNVLSDAKRTYV